MKQNYREKIMAHENYNFPPGEETLFAKYVSEKASLHEISITEVLAFIYDRERGVCEESFSSWKTRKEKESNGQCPEDSKTV